MKKTSRSGLVFVLATLAAGAFACSAPQPASKTVPPSPTPQAQTTPTPGPEMLSRTNPNIVEEDETHIVERYRKTDHVRLDDKHFRSFVSPLPIEFYKEDETYYYVYSYKRNAQMDAVSKALKALTGTPTPAPPPPGTTPTPPGPSLSDFEDLNPPRESGHIRLEPVAKSGLPTGGLWRASFVIADVNGDGIPDIVAPPSRLGDARLHVWIGDGKGGFTAWPLKFVEKGQPKPDFSLDYGGVAVGDIDGDGHQDIVAASHSAGLVSLFGDGKGTFRVERAGLPTANFSSQAVALLDADGDGKLDIVASTDIAADPLRTQDEVRVYLYRGAKGWLERRNAIVSGVYSNSLHAWDFNGDGKMDLLTGSNHLGMLKLLWKNVGKGQFEPVEFPELEIYSFHFTTAPGTFGKRRVPAFADNYQMIVLEPQPARASGISVYSYEKGSWTRHRVWRKNAAKSSQYALAMGDLDGDGLDDVVFADSDVDRLRIFFQKPNGTFVEMAESEEPVLDSPGQCVRLADLNRDGRLDIVLSKTVASYRSGDPGGWNVYLNRR